AGFAHRTAVTFVPDQANEGVRGRADVYDGRLAARGQVDVVVDLAEEVLRRRLQRRAAQHHRGYEIARPALHDQVAVAVPIGHDRGYAAGHRFDHDQPEGFLDVVGKRREDVRGVPDGIARRRVSAVEEVGPDFGGERPRTVDEGPQNALVGRPARA